MSAAIDPEKVLQALGDPTRRAMIARLRIGPASVSRLAEPLGVTLTAVAQHLQILEECGLAVSEKAGRVRTCRLIGDGFAVLEAWCRAMRPPWEQALDRLGDLLDED